MLFIFLWIIIFRLGDQGDPFSKSDKQFAEKHDVISKITVSMSQALILLINNQIEADMETNIYVKYKTFRRKKVGIIYFTGQEDVCKIYFCEYISYL